MDLALFGRVLWRFRAIVLLGLVLACAVAFFSVVRVSFDSGLNFTYRQPELFRSKVTLLVTQEGFPWGRTIPEAATRGTGEQAIPRFADSRRYAGLATIYSEFANSDEVRQLMARIPGSERGTIEAGAVTDATGVSSLPLMQIVGIAPIPADAILVARNGAEALRRFLKAEQIRNGIPAEQRVVVNELQSPRGAELYVGRKKTRPAFLFLAIMSLAVAAAFVLENARPRVSLVQSRAGADPFDETAARRSA